MITKIVTFLNDIDYKAKKKEIEDMEVKISDDALSLKTLSDNNIALDLEKKEKENAKKDEGIAASPTTPTFGHPSWATLAASSASYSA